MAAHKIFNSPLNHAHCSTGIAFLNNMWSYQGPTKILSYSFFGCSTITKTLMTLLVSGVVFPCKAEVVNIFQVLIISACVMRVGTLVIILRNINDLANGVRVRAQGGSILQQVGQYRAGGIGCTRAIGLKDTTQPSCQ